MRPLQFVATTAVVLLLASVLSFLLVDLAPGDVAKLIAEKRTPSPSVEQVEQVRRQYHLDDPLPARYGRWLGAAAHGDLGRSLRTSEPVVTELGSRVGTTAFLIGGGAAVALLAGFGAGLAGALRPGGPIDRLTHLGALLGGSTPNFFLAQLLVLVFALRLDLVPTIGAGSPAAWILPWIVVSTPAAAIISRLVRVGLAEQLAQPYATTAFSRGSARRSVLIRDALPNILGQLVVVLAAQAGLMITAGVIVETIFGWTGVGSYFLQAARFRDIPALQACLLLFAVTFILLNAAADLAQRAIDPRIRHYAAQGGRR